ncbi:MAG: hypothetical protein ACR2NY_06170 [Alphaproteobacteria bacterium]
MFFITGRVIIQKNLDKNNKSAVIFFKNKFIARFVIAIICFDAMAELAGFVVFDG